MLHQLVLACRAISGCCLGTPGFVFISTRGWYQRVTCRGSALLRCASCIEVVSHSYKHLAVRAKEELFFASRWVFQLGISVINAEYFVKNATGSECKEYVAEVQTDAPQVLRGFRNIDCSTDQCLTASASGLVLQDCDHSATQLLDANQAGHALDALAAVFCKKCLRACSEDIRIQKVACEVSLLLLQSYQEEESSDTVITGEKGMAYFHELELETECGGTSALRAFSFGQAGCFVVL